MGEPHTVARPNLAFQPQMLRRDQKKACQSALVWRIGRTFSISIR